jgi:hypothetical protein
MLTVPAQAQTARALTRRFHIAMYRMPAYSLSYQGVAAIAHAAQAAIRAGHAAKGTASFIDLRGHARRITGSRHCISMPH